MAEPLKIEELTERVILTGVRQQDNDDTEDSLTELAELVRTAGAQVVGRTIQNRESIHPGTYVGKGKLQELKEMVLELDATGIVCDDELSPAQLRNMEDALECKVMDRTLVILDIFASRASTSEGKIQVELAQLKYRMSRLAGLGISMSRLGGGIGTRGPGEKKLEVDRRLIKSRIAQLNRELSQVQMHREVTRSQRERSQVKVAAIVGYTNAGKSTLLNRLTNASVLEEDKLFATLDPTTRNLKLDSGQEILLTHKEYELLSLFMANPGQIFSRGQLLNRIWGYDFEGTTRTVDTHIKTLRQKLGDEGKHIVTLIRSGYKFEVSVCE